MDDKTQPTEETAITSVLEDLLARLNAVIAERKLSGLLERVEGVISERLPTTSSIEESPMDKRLTAISKSLGFVIEALEEQTGGEVNLKGSFEGKFSGDGRNIKYIQWHNIVGRKKMVGGSGNVLSQFPSASFAEFAYTASFALNAGAGNAISSSHSLRADIADVADEALLANEALLADEAISSSYALTASFALNAGGTPNTGSYTGSFTGAFQGDGSQVIGVISATYAQTASLAITTSLVTITQSIVSSSHADTADSASYALTASFALNGGGTGGSNDSKVLLLATWV